ncbi:MAG: hypothetical protein GX284_00590 [Clostridiales bacterium]|nr:hypothetical protein [Clostridiales bacterium]
MYTSETWYFNKSIEWEYKWKGEYGRKGEKRGERKKKTPEQVKEQNKRNKENRVRRLMKANFHENDLWITLKYQAGTKLQIEEVKKHMRKFLEKSRNAYKRRGELLKFIYRVEIGKRGSPHVHVLINRIPDADLIIKKNWEHGRVYFGLAYEEGGFRKLAEYIVKPPNDEVDEQNETKAYSTSRNLIRPEPEKKTYWRRTVEKMIKEGPKPTPGYAIDPNTIVSGVNPYTGMSYLKYEEIKLERSGQGARGKRIRGDNS